jgi:hypothetical protein
LVLGVSVSVGCSKEQDFNSWIKESEENRALFIEIHQDFKEINEEFLHIADLTGQVFMNAEIDMCINEVNYLESKIGHLNDDIADYNERIAEGDYHDERCEEELIPLTLETAYDRRVQLRSFCYECEHYHRWNDYLFGEPMTKDDMLNNIQECKDDIEWSIKRIAELKVKAVEIDRQKKAGVRPDDINDLKDDIKADMKWNEESKQRGLEAFDSFKDGINQIEYK